MGGSGSGSYYRWDSKETTESQHRIDIRWLKAQGYLRTGYFGTIFWSFREEKTGSIGYHVESDCIVLKYRRREGGGDWESIEQRINFDWTPCNYGGHRTWFLCSKCNRRVAVIYGAGKYFLCRHCCNLTYSSQQEGHADRMMRKARKIRKRLGSTAPHESWVSKPKDMHYKTYYKLLEQADAYESLGWRIFEQKYKCSF